MDAVLDSDIDTLMSESTFISGDRDLLDLFSYEGVPVLTPGRVLQHLRESET